ncbi:pyridoxamine 5'-phosphate oxidase family protein [Diaminobutyricibacter sp. McL0618]|uniref:pyridoxamine 5'-phosphate oxidase family protein n=1 Tax=Leifsonia sp. McL0618 TaxID=3415677 RepID=UPI003CF54526
MSAATASFASELDDLQSRSLREILSTSRLLSLATVSPDGEAHINTAFFAFSADFAIYLLSPTTSEHATHAGLNPSAAVAVFDSHQTRERRRGVQLFGRLEEVAPGDGDAVLACFRSRFPDVAGENETYDDVVLTHGSALYAFHPERVKLFDEALLIADAYVEIPSAVG